MKLHLPLSLLAAVTLAMLGSQHAWATTVNTASTAISADATDTVAAGQIFSGFIFTLDTTTSTYADTDSTSATAGSGYYMVASTTVFDQYGTVQNAAEGTTANSRVEGDDLIDASGQDSDSGWLFWRHYTTGNVAGTYGNTLRLADIDTTNDTYNNQRIKIGGDFGPIALGGLIVERNLAQHNAQQTDDSAKLKWSVGRWKGSAELRLTADTGVNVNLFIGSDTELHGSKITVTNGGNWAVDGGQTLSFDNATTIESNQEVNISRLNDSGEGTVSFESSLTLNAGAEMNIGSGVRVSAGSINAADTAAIMVRGTLSGTLTAGTVTMDGGSLDAFTLNGGTLNLGAVSEGAFTTVQGTGDIALTNGALVLEGYDSLGVGTYELLTTTGTLSTGTLSTFNDHLLDTNNSFLFTIGSSNYSGTLGISNANTLTLTLTSISIAELTWQSGSGTWVTGGTGWETDGAESFSANAAVTFGANSATAEAPESVAISGTVAPSTMLVAAGGSYEFTVADDTADSLGGSGELTISGTATFNGTQSQWAGTTTVTEGGSLSVGDTSALLNHLTVESGGKVNVTLSGSKTSASFFPIEGEGDVNIDTKGYTWTLSHAVMSKANATATSSSSFAGNITLSGGGTLRLGNTGGGSYGNYTISEQVLGTSGNITLTGSNTTLMLHMTQSGTASITKGIILGSGTTLQTEDGNYSFDSVQLEEDATANLLYQYDKTITIKSLTGASGTLVQSGNNWGGGSLNITEALSVKGLTLQQGITTISAANASVGTLTVNKQDNNIGSDVTLSGSDATVTEAIVNDGTLTVSGANASIGTLTANGGTTTLSNTSVDIDQLAIAGGTVTLSSTSAYNNIGAVSIANGSSFSVNAANNIFSDVTLEGALSVAATDNTTTSTFSLSGAGNLNITVDSGKTWKIYHTNTATPDTESDNSGYTGNITLSGGGVLQLGEGENNGTNFSLSSKALGTSGSITLSGEGTTLNLAMTQKGTSDIDKTIILGDGTTLQTKDGNHVLKEVQVEANATANLVYNYDKNVTIETLTGASGTLVQTGNDWGGGSLNITEALTVKGLTLQQGTTTISADNASIGTLTVNKQSSQSSIVTISGANASITTANVIDGTLTISGENAHVGTLTATGGTTTLSNATITVDTLSVSNATAQLTEGSGNYQIGQVTIGDGGILHVGAGSGYSASLSSADITISGGGKLAFLNGPSGTIGTSGGSITVDATDEKSAILSGTWGGNTQILSNINGTGTLEFQKNGNYSNTVLINGSISGDTLALKASSGNYQLSSTNSYGGGTTVTDTAVLTVAADEALGNGEVTVEGGSLTVSGTRTLSNDISAVQDGTTVATIGAENASYTGVTITESSFSGSISGADISIEGAYSLTDATLTNVRISAGAAANLTNSQVTLTGESNILTLASMQDGVAIADLDPLEVSYTLYESNVLNNTTLTGTLQLDLTQNAITQYEQVDKLAIALTGLNSSADSAVITVSDAMTSAFGEVDYITKGESQTLIVFKGTSQPSESIPEPTTATLSLLALAALAARRRRK